jgi:hypothetical protein
MMSIASSMPNQLRLNFWQPQFMNSQPSPVAMQQFQQPQPSWQPSAVLSSVAGNSVNPATAANSRNFATTTRQFIKAGIKFKTSELESLAIFRDHHANFRRVSHGIRN